MRRPPIEFMRGIYFAQEYAKQLSEEAQSKYWSLIEELSNLNKSKEQLTREELIHYNYELGKLQGRQDGLDELDQKIVEAAYAKFN